MGIIPITNGDNNMTEETKFCANCGAEITKEATTCPECGVLQQDKTVAKTNIKNSGFAAILSFFVAGLGQIYNGDIGKGIILICLQVVNVLLMFILIGFLTYPIVWIYGVWDAYTRAEAINKGEIEI